MKREGGALSEGESAATNGNEGEVSLAQNALG